MNRSMWKKTALHSALATVLALSVGAALSLAAHHEQGEKDGHGHHGKGHHGKHFDKRDSDGNGEVSKAEWLAGAEERFAKMDADGSGAITREEYKAAHQAMKKRWKEHHGGE